MNDRSTLKGGLKTRRGGRVYDQYDNIKRACGCNMGQCKCENPATKQCPVCNTIFERPKGISNLLWERRKCCSKSCSTKLRWKTTGFSRPKKDKLDRLIGKVIKNTGTNCWEWQGSHDGNGYGTMSTKRGCSPVKAHRFSWELHYGPIHPELNVLHACDNRSCVNPKHLMLGTQEANLVDASKKGRMKKGGLNV